MGGLSGNLASSKIWRQILWVLIANFPQNGKMCLLRGDMRSPGVEVFGEGFALMVQRALILS